MTQQPPRTVTQQRRAPGYGRKPGVDGCFFSTVERKAVVAFLHWLQAQWPDDPDIGASIDAIWAG